MKKIEIKGTMASLTKDQMGIVTGGFGILETDPGIGVTPYLSDKNGPNRNSGINCFNENCICVCGPNSFESSGTSSSSSEV